MAEPDAGVIAAIGEVAGSAHDGFRNSFGRIHNQRHRWNHELLYRVWRQMKLNLPRSAKRRVPQRTRQPLPVMPETNALGIDIAASIRAVRVTAFVANLIEWDGHPQARLRSRIFRIARTCSITMFR
jgi:hypothetical protein